MHPLMCFSAAIGVGFYGNEATHNGMTQLATSTRDVDMSIDHMQHQVSISTRLKKILI